MDWFLYDNSLRHERVKQFDLSNPPTYNHTETDSTENVSCEFSDNFWKCWMSAGDGNTLVK